MSWTRPRDGSDRRSQTLRLTLVFVVAAGLRLALALGWPAVRGDTAHYRAVAARLFDSCAALAGALPGYPGVLAAFGDGARVVQSLVAAGVITWSAAQVAPRARLGVGLLLGLSLATVAHARFLMTETLCLSGTLWVFAELVRAQRTGQLSALRLALALSLAVYMRVDSIVLLLPVGIVALGHRRLVPAGLAGLLLAATLLPWWAVCPPEAPKVRALPGAWRLQQSYGVRAQDTADFYWRLGAAQTERAVVPDIPEAEAIQQLLAQVPAGALPSPTIDEALGQLAAQRPSAWHLIPARVWSLWTEPHPLRHHGWPHAGFAVVVSVYRGLLLVLAIVLALRRRTPLGLAVLALIALRTVMLAAAGLLEARYLVPILPVLELFVAGEALSGFTPVSAADPATQPAARSH